MGSAPIHCSRFRLPASLSSNSDKRVSNLIPDNGVCFKKLNDEDGPTFLVRVGDMEDDTRRHTCDRVKESADCDVELLPQKVVQSGKATGVIADESKGGWDSVIRVCSG